MNKRKLASALLAGALLFITTLPASAADVADVPTPEQVFYREEPGQTFEGKYTLRINTEEQVGSNCSQGTRNMKRCQKNMTKGIPPKNGNPPTKYYYADLR